MHRLCFRVIWIWSARSVQGVEHDFEKDGLDLIIRDGRLTANGTTLGGDNGVAVADVDGAG